MVEINVNNKNNEKFISEATSTLQQIKNNLSVVEDIAEQTNMLALNASVEAARAGEHGKGFAIVAGEIRKLSEEAKETTAKIDVNIIVEYGSRIPDVAFEIQNRVKKAVISVDDRLLTAIIM